MLYYAPQILGDTARGMFALPPLASLAERVELELGDVRRIGRDLRIVARPLAKHAKPAQDVENAQGAKAPNDARSEPAAAADG